MYYIIYRLPNRHTNLWDNIPRENVVAACRQILMGDPSVMFTGADQMLLAKKDSDGSYLVCKVTLDKGTVKFGRPSSCYEEDGWKPSMMEMWIKEYDIFE